jgi:Ca-activated chloride channel family protein
MFNPRAFLNSRPDGFGVLELADAPRRFVPLRKTDLAGEVVGPLAALRLAQTFALDGPPDGPAVEALYRFPLPGDAAVTAVRVRFGAVEIRTALKERGAAEAEYADAKRTSRQAALVTRESPDVFTLAVAGVRPDEPVVVETEYVQLARPGRGGWSLRVPLTTAPRYVRADEAGSRHAGGQPLAVLRDPGHRFALDLAVRGAARVTSPTHQLAVTRKVDCDRVRLADGEVIPDRDCVVEWQAAAADRPALAVWFQPDPAAGRGYFLVLCTPPAAATPVAREVVLLVDHSGSMGGAKWEAADWAVERFLAGLAERDAFALGVFHNDTRWFAPEPRPATPAAVREAVAYLKASRDQGGTELGVALEQALGLPRADGTPARHVLVITDAQVTDAGRLLRLADAEAGRPDRRRVSVLCIDAAPNAGLADELAARGGGVARYLTSDPAEDDVTTALDEVLADWAAPTVAGLALEVDRPGVEAAGRTVSLVVPGPGSAIDLGDPPAGRPVWVVGRVPLGNEPPRFGLRAAVAGTVAECDPASADLPGVKALFGADRIRRLEYLAHSGLTGDELTGELARLGIDPVPAVCAENAAKAVRGVLVRESLDGGLPCSETAFVAVRSEPGRPVAETVVVANALPAGWDDGFAGAAGLTASGAAFGRVMCRMAPLSAGGMARKMLRAPSTAPSARLAAAGPARAAETAPAPNEVRVAVPAGRHPAADGAVLFDAAADPGLPDACRLTGLTVALAAAAAVDPGLTLLVFVGDTTAPRARVRLADVLGGGRRPLNLRRDAGQAVRLVLEDPAGAWAGGVPALAVAIAWEP